MKLQCTIRAFGFYGCSSHVAKPNSAEKLRNFI
jgi:hypothetical protein